MGDLGHRHSRMLGEVRHQLDETPHLDLSDPIRQTSCNCPEPGHHVIHQLVWRQAMASAPRAQISPTSTGVSDSSS